MQWLNLHRFSEIGPTESKTIFIFTSSTLRLLIEPTKASNEPFCVRFQY